MRYILLKFNNISLDGGTVNANYYRKSATVHCTWRIDF